jgi:hypothetical protein
MHCTVQPGKYCIVLPPVIAAVEFSSPCDRSNEYAGL